ncbi:MAG: hypothetical protein IJP44_06330 [Bacteroidales bacterium]|nr:hypothetical protein [Bacteroidales bacterium]
MQKLILFITAFSLQISMFAQQKGFFFTERDPEHCSTNGKFSVETADGCYIVSEVSVLSSLDETQLDILKFSSEGELLNRAVVGKNLEVAGLFRIPDEENHYCLILDNENVVSIPRITRFDDEFNILSTIDVELPQNIPNDYVISARALINKDSKVYYTFSNLGEETCRIHLLFTLDGMLETFTIEQQFHNAGSSFLLPDESCCSYIDGSLSRLDDSLFLDQILLFDKILDEPVPGNVSRQVWVNGASYPTAIALPDTSILIAEECHEVWYQTDQGIIINQDWEQMAFFKSSLENDVGKVITVGSHDTLERPAYFQAIDYGKVFADKIIKE